MTAKDQSVRAKSIEGRHERSEAAMKPDAQQKKNALAANGSDNQMPSSSAQGKVSGIIRGSDEPPKLLSDEGVKVSKPTAESEVRIFLPVYRINDLNYCITRVIYAALFCLDAKH